MRGVVSAGMLTAIDDLGLSGVFDAVYACSSGSVNAAYFLAGESWYPLTIYFDDLNTKRFVDLRRFVLPGPILDLEYVFEEVLLSVKPLRYDEILDGPTALHVAVTMIDTLEPVDASDFTSEEDLKAGLRASCWLPMAVPGTAGFRGRPAVDGGVLTAHPSLMAIADSCSHVLSLSTKPLKPPPRRFTASQLASAAFMERLRRGLGRAYLDSVRRYRGHRARLQRWMTEPGDGPVKVLDLAPLPWMDAVAKHQIALGPILTAARESHAIMTAAVEGISASAIRDGRFTSLPRLVSVRRADQDRLS